MGGGGVWPGVTIGFFSYLSQSEFWLKVLHGGRGVKNCHFWHNIINFMDGPQAFLYSLVYLHCKTDTCSQWIVSRAFQRYMACLCTPLPLPRIPASQLTRSLHFWRELNCGAPQIFAELGPFPPVTCKNSLLTSPRRSNGGQKVWAVHFWKHLGIFYHKYNGQVVQNSFPG